MNDEQQIAALREEIRWAGKLTGGLRVGLAAPVVGLVLLAVVSVLLASYPYGTDPPDYYFQELMLAGRYVLGGAAVVLLVAYPVALSYRSWLRLRLYKRLSVLRQEQRAEVLIPLRTDKVGDIRKLVEPLIRQFRLRTELAPAAMPDARGDEVSAPESLG